MPDFVEAWGPGGVGLRVAFEQRGDRLGHVIQLVGTSHQAGEHCLISREGSPSDVWPTSPPLQSLHLEDRNQGQRVALLVGLSGKSHWSLSVEPVAGEAAVRFDVACRANAEPAMLGSTYRELRPGLIVDSSDSVVCEEQCIAIAPASLATGTRLPRTIRWTYVIRRNS